MSASFRLVNKSGKVAAVGWCHIINDSVLDAFEVTLKGKTDQQLQKMGVTRQELDVAFDVIRQLPLKGADDLMDGDDFYLTQAIPSSKCYALPFPTKFRASTTLVPTGPSSLEAMEWWSKAREIGQAYQTLYDAMGKLTQAPHAKGFEYHVEDFDTAAKTGQSIKRNTITVEEMVSSAETLTCAQGYVIYLIDIHGQEGYINRTALQGNLSTALVFENLNAAQRYINNLNKHPSGTAGDSFTVMEVNLSVQPTPLIQQGTLPSDSDLFEAMARQQAKTLSQEVGLHDATPKALRSKKL